MPSGTHRYCLMIFPGRAQLPVSGENGGILIQNKKILLNNILIRILCFENIFLLFTS